MSAGLFGDDALSAQEILANHHYLGPISRGAVFRDDDGVLVFANPTSRRLPQATWLELVRWCILRGRGSRQWSHAVSWVREHHPHITTVVSYSDPSAGHTGVLYRASGWLWAPTWHRLREPPSGNGSWKQGKRQAVKDRWVFLLKEDDSREAILRVHDESLRKRMPWAEYREPSWKRGKPQLHTGGGDIRPFLEHAR